MALSGSRNAALILLVPLFLLLWNRKTIKTAAVMIGITIVALVAITAFTSVDTGIRKTVFFIESRNVAVEKEENRRNENISSRFLLWQSAWAMFRDYPLTGIGPGGSNRAMKDYVPADLSATPKRNINHEYLNAHNGILNIMAEFGLTGAAAALAFMAYLIVCFIRRYGGFPPGPVHVLPVGIVFSFLPDAFFYSLFYMSVVLTIFLLFAFPGNALGPGSPPMQPASPTTEKEVLKNMIPEREERP
ncbi:MAG: O-antigen ligase family protein [Smithellaceae bacterium]